MIEIKGGRVVQLLLIKGKLTGPGVALLFLVGLLIPLGALAFLPVTWMKRVGALVGLACMAIAGLSGRAHALKLPPPFTNDPLGWRKAKATYEQQADAEAHNSIDTSLKSNQ